MPNGPTTSPRDANASTRPGLAAVGIPWLLLSVRVILTPLLIYRVHALTDHAVFWIYILVFVTDYLDGATARYFGTATPLLRKADSTADTIFHLALAYLIFCRHPDEFSRNRIALTIYLGTTIIWYVLDAVRWRRAAGFHAYSAKVFAILLLIWVLLLFGGGRTSYLLSGILYFGVLSNIECIFISLLLRQDRPDVPTIFRLLRERKE